MHLKRSARILLTFASGLLALTTFSAVAWADVVPLAESAEVGDYKLTLANGQQPVQGTNYTFSDPSGPLTLIGTEPMSVRNLPEKATSSIPIVIGDGSSAPTVTLDGVNIDTSMGGSAAICISSDVSAPIVTVSLSGPNIVTSGGSHAGLEVPSNHGVVITTAEGVEGGLTATGGSDAGGGAGIGASGGGNGTISAITIQQHASVQASVGDGHASDLTAAAIGGAGTVSVTSITITSAGATSALTSGSAPAIGSGATSTGATEITLSSGDVRARNAGSGPAIGAADGGGTAVVSLATTGTIEAVSVGGNAIATGSDTGQPAGSVTVNAGTVTAQSSSADGFGISTETLTLKGSAENITTVVTASGTGGAVRVKEVSFSSGSTAYQHVTYGNGTATSQTNTVVEFTGMAPTFDPMRIFNAQKWLRTQPFDPAALHVIPPTAAVPTGDTQMFALGITAAAPADFPSGQDLSTLLGAMWSVDGGSSPGTSIDAAGTLTVGADETHAHLTVAGMASSEWGESWPDVEPRATAVVTVIMPEPVSAISVTPKQATLKVGESIQLTAAITPSDATDKMVQWTSSDPTIATVDQNGLVTSVSKGTVAITATTDDGNLSDSSTIIVLPTIAPKPGPVPQTGDGGLTALPWLMLLGAGLCITGLAIARREESGE